MSQVSKVLDQKLTPLSRKFSELIPSVSNKCSPFSNVIPFLKVPLQRNIPKQVATSKTKELLINQEIMEMPDKGAITKVEHQFLSNILLVKKDGGNRPCINLKAPNKFIPYMHFKMVCIA